MVQGQQDDIRRQNAARLRSNSRRMLAAILVALAVALLVYNIAVKGPDDADTVGFWASTLVDIVVGAAATVGVAVLAFWIARRGGVLRR